jgi:DNA-binding response OmpR family regulator
MTMTRKILIADDDRVLAELVSTRLRAEGFETLVAFDSVQAHMMAVRTLPDAILLDVKMPGGTGVDTLRKLKGSSRTCAIPVVVASSLSDPALPATVRDLGAAEFLRKPVTFDDVHAALVRALPAAS